MGSRNVGRIKKLRLFESAPALPGYGAWEIHPMMKTAVND
jgi:hypothetical protein